MVESFVYFKAACLTKSELKVIKSIGNFIKINIYHNIIIKTRRQLLYQNLYLFRGKSYIFCRVGSRKLKNNVTRLSIFKLASGIIIILTSRDVAHSLLTKLVFFYVHFFTLQLVKHALLKKKTFHSIKLTFF